MQNKTNNTFFIIAVIAVLVLCVVAFLSSSSYEPESVAISGTTSAVAPVPALDTVSITTESDEVSDSVSVIDDMSENKDNMDTTEELAVTEVVPTEPELVSEPVDTAAPAPVATFPGTFSDYDESKLVAGETNVLFFHADWCPSCRGLERDLNANLSAIPAGVNILKLDYDSETELKREYKVIRQHTLVVVDGDGVEIKKLTGLTNTLDQVVNQL